MKALPAPPPGSPKSALAPGARRLGVALATAACLAIAWSCLALISVSDPWYRNASLNVHNLADALAVNSNAAPMGIGQPGLPPKYLLALDYRVRHYLGGLPVWNLRKLGGSADPLRELPRLIHLERTESRAQVFLLMLAAAGLVYAITGEMMAAGFTLMLLCGSAGLLFHGLLGRPELACAGFGSVAGPWCAWRATSAGCSWRRQLWLFLAGICGGLAALSALPGLYALVFTYAWCWLSAGAGPSVPTAGPSGRRLWADLLPFASAACFLCLLQLIAPLLDAPGATTLFPLRVAAVTVGLLPMLAWLRAHHRAGSFLLDRAGDLAALGAGALAAAGLAYLMLRAVLDAGPAQEYLARLLHAVLSPLPEDRLFLLTTSHVGRELLRFGRETPGLFAGATALVIGASFRPSLPVRIRAFLWLLLLQGLGTALLLSRQSYALPYGILVQVPLLLLVAIGLAAFGVFRPRPPDASWAFPLAVTAALILAATSYFRLQPAYVRYQDDAGRPVSDLTLTYLFDHHTHPRRYVEIMIGHYHDRKQFDAALERYLDDPAHRY